MPTSEIILHPLRPRKFIQKKRQEVCNIKKEEKTAVKWSKKVHVYNVHQYSVRALPNTNYLHME